MNNVKIKVYSNNIMKYEYFVSVDDWYDSRCKEIDDKRYIKSQCINMVEIFKNENRYLNFYDKNGNPTKFEVYRNGIRTNTECVYCIKGCFLSMEFTLDKILQIKYLYSATKKRKVSNIVIDILNCNNIVYTRNIIILEKSHNDAFTIPLQDFTNLKCKVVVKNLTKTIKEFIVDI